MKSDPKLKLRLIGFLLPGLIQVGSVLFLAAIQHPRATSDSGVFTLFLVAFSIVMGALVFSLGAFDRFWKVHLFAVIAATIPVSSVFLIGYLMKGAEGYFWLGLAVVVFIFIIATILATPLTALTYVFVKRRLESKYIILGSSLEQSTHQHFSQEHSAEPNR